MGTILFGYKNEADNADTLTFSAAAGTNTKDLVQAVQPFRFYRTATLTPASLRFQWNTEVEVQLIAPLYTSSTPWRNRFRNGNGFDTNWTASGVGTPVQSSTVYSPEYLYAWTLTEDSSAGNHMLQQGVQLPGSYTAYTGGLSQSVLAKAGTRDHLKLNLWGNVTGNKAATFILSGAGSVFGTPSADSYSITRSTVDTDWYELIVRAVMESTDTTQTATIRMHNGTSDSYTGSGSDTVLISAAQLETPRLWDFTAATRTAYYDTGTVRGPLWRHTGSNIGTNWSSLALDGDVSGYGFAHAYNVLSAPAAANDITLSLYDEDNTDSYIDVGRVYIGPVLQPSVQGLVRFAQTQRGQARVWRIGIDYANEADAVRSFGELHRTLDIGQGEPRIMVGGHPVAPRLKDCVVIIDPDETAYVQEQIICGYVYNLEREYRGIAATHGNLHSVTMDLWETLP